MIVDLSADSKRGGRWKQWRLALSAMFHHRRPPISGARYDARSYRLRKLGEVCAVLDAARTLIQQGWVQNNWYAVRNDDDDASAVVTFTAKPLTGAQVHGACLVGAVVHATRTLDPTAGSLEAAPALDVLWDAWQESRGLNGPGVAGRATPRDVRAARMRDLTRWNDQPGRAREDVLRLLDLATTRAIMEAANTERVTALHAR